MNTFICIVMRKAISLLSKILILKVVSVIGYEVMFKIGVCRFIN